MDTCITWYKLLAGDAFPAISLVRISWDSLRVHNILSYSFFSGDSQQLFVRLFLRKHQWLRTIKISYPEISTDINILITDLVDNKLLWNGKKIKLIIHILTSHINNNCNNLFIHMNKIFVIHAYAHTSTNTYIYITHTHMKTLTCIQLYINIHTIYHYSQVHV